LGKRKNTIEGGFGQVFIGSRVVIDGRAIHNGGRDVDLVVAVAFSCASGGEDEDVDPLRVFISSETTWACIGLLFELGLDCCWAV
jgi:hypothetical protein